MGATGITEPVAFSYFAGTAPFTSSVLDSVVSTPTEEAPGIIEFYVFAHILFIRI